MEFKGAVQGVSALAEAWPGDPDRPEVQNQQMGVAPLLAQIPHPELQDREVISARSHWPM